MHFAQTKSDEMRFLKTFTILIYLYSGWIAVGQIQSDEKLIVVIDPGHGGTDPGALGLYGINEKDVVLSIARKLDSLNSQILDSKFEIYLTRYKDTLISLKERTRLANSLNAPVFISIHCNQANNRSAAGTEVYIYPKSKSQAAEASYLGFTIQQDLYNSLGLKNRGLKYGDFQVLRNSNDSRATVLLELGFLSHPDEAGYLAKEKSQLNISYILLKSITKYLAP